MHRILSVVVRAEKPSHTARQTRALQKTPRKKASEKPNEVFAVAIASAVFATLPLPSA